jgi:antirestriction protein ArdC
MFRCSLARFTAGTAKVVPQAISAASGMRYPLAIAEKLTQLGFSSTLWLTEKQMKAAGVTLLPAQKEKGYTMTSESGVSFMVYNASQTSNPEKVEVMKGRLTPFYALTSEKVTGEIATVFATHCEAYPTNRWFSRKEIEALGLKMKPAAKAVTVSFQFKDTVKNVDGTETTEVRKVDKDYFNVAELESPEIVEKIAKVFPLSASTGRKYEKKFALPMIRAALDKGYDSPFWTTLQNAQGQGLTVKDTTAGVDIMIGKDKTMTFYNATETSNPAKVAASAYKAQFSPRSAMSGAAYPEPASNELVAAALRNKHRSVYWLTQKQAMFLGVSILPGQQPTEVKTNDATIRVFNADQTSDREGLEARCGKH